MAGSLPRPEKFAQLFDYFEYLASRRYKLPNASETTTIVTGGQTGECPDVDKRNERAATIEGLQAIPSNRRRSVDFIPTGASSQPLSVRQASISHSTSPVAIAKFPPDDSYTFTFKLMIYKLYDLREWVNMVREVVDKSQLEFKSLAEQQRKNADVEENANKTRDALIVIGSKKGGIPYSRTRRHSVIGIARSEIRPIIVAKGQVSISKSGEWHADVRMVKKRCIERNRTEIPSTPGVTSPTTSEWTYRAAGSLVECRQHRDDPRDWSRNRCTQLNLARESENDAITNVWEPSSCDGTQAPASWQREPLSPTLSLKKGDRGRKFGQRVWPMLENPKEQK